MYENALSYRKICVLILILICITFLFTLLPFSYLYSNEQAGSKDDDDVIKRVSTDQKVIALTFDDGPRPTYLPKILEVLKQNNVKATFFFIGSQVMQFPELAKLTLAQGHELGNHTFSHRNPLKLSETELQKEIETTQKSIFSTTGYMTTLFRSPLGKYNDATLKTVKRTGHKMILWSYEQDSRDWASPGVGKIVNTVVSNASNGDIVILHDTKLQTVEALKRIIPKLKEEGFRFVTISELIQLGKSSPKKEKRPNP
jgi:peptidoglycan-N-acetylglucosamine deacetylase